MDLEWKDGGSENFRWAIDGRGSWCAVWQVDHYWIAWVNRAGGTRDVTHHPTEALAMTHCQGLFSAAES